MKRFILLHLCLVVSLLCLTDISAQSNLRKWTETSVEEFSRGKLQDVIITNLSGGEIQLPAPLIKTSQDTNENNEPVFEAKDNAGNSFRTWVLEGNVYVQKYSSAGKALTSAIAVNDTPGIAGKDGVSRVAAFDDGSFIVVWADLNSYALDPQERMFAQVFRNDSIKVKNNFQINHLKNGSGCYPVVIANKYDSNFWIFTSLYQGQNYRLFAQKRDKNGNLIGEIFTLNDAPLTKAEMRPAAVWDGNGFSIAWEGFDSNVSTYVDIYIECFNPDGTIRRSAVKVNDDVGPFMQASASICADTKGNILVAFVDARLTTPKEYNGVDNIFGQLFNPNGNKVGSNIRLENSPYIYNVSPQISCENGEFIISWTIYDNSNQRYLYYKNRWKADPKSSGTFTSGIFNSGPSGTELKELSWTDSLSGGSNILFKLRSAPSVEALMNTPWYGPADTMSYYTVSSGSKINLQNNSGRYVQYKAILETADGISPILKSVTINYLPADTIPPLVPSGLTAKSGHSSNSINWERNPEKDLAFYVIYRGKTSRQYDPGWRKVVSYYKTSFIDSSAVSGNKYYYVITSLDSSGNESGFSNEVSVVPYGINIYVSKTGNAGASGTIDDPFGNITSAINAAMFGDTVRVLPGSYDEIFTMRNGVSLIGTNVETCLLKAKYLDAADSLIIKNLTFTGFLTCLNVSPVITGNIFRQADPNGAAIRALQDANPVIINNFITECEAGILIPFDSAPVIKNNIIQTHGVAIDIGIQAKPQVINNTILFTEHFGIRLIMSDAAVIRNNIMVGTNAPYSIGIESSQGNAAIIEYNDIWNVPSTGITGNTAGNISTDPLFEDQSAQNFKLKVNSPCRDAGNPEAKYNDTDGSRNDMGAFGGPEPFFTKSALQLTRSISISGISAYPGDTVTAKITLDNAIGLTSADFSLRFDSRIVKFADVKLTSQTADFLLNSKLVSPDELQVSMKSSSIMPPGFGNILEIRLILPSSLKPNDASPLSLRNLRLLDQNGKEILLRSITDGTIVVNNFSEGKHSIYVNCFSTSSEDGSRHHPYRTIMKAVNKAVSGDTIFVSGGTYTEKVEMKEGIHLIGSGAAVTYLVSSQDNIGVVFSNIQYAELSGFTLTGDEKHIPFAPYIVCEYASPLIKKNRINTLKFSEIGISLWYNSNATLEDNYMNNTSVEINASSPVIKNNVIEGGEPFGAIRCFGNDAASLIKNNVITGSIHVSSSGAVIRNNTIYTDHPDITGGVMLNQASNVIVANNIFYDRSGIGKGIDIRDSKDIEILNNTILKYGKGIYDELSTAKVYNNIISGANSFGAQLSSTSVMSYNDLWNNYVNYRGPVSGANDIFADPMFADTTKGDYRLKSGSKLINAGNPDIKYNDRDGSRNDIGAFGGPLADSSWTISGSSALMIDSAAAFSSDTVEVAIDGKKLTGIAGLNLSISFDPSLLKIINANTGNLTRSFSLEKKQADEGSVNLILSSEHGINSEGGELIKLYFVSKASKSFSTYIKLDSAKASFEAAYQKNIVELKNGSVNITVTGVNDKTSSIPSAYKLYQNYPNPFNPSTTIMYDLPRDNNISIRIYDILGREVICLFNGFQKAGSFKLNWNAVNLPSGIYFYRIESGSFTDVKKMMLIK